MNTFHYEFGFGDGAAAIILGLLATWAIVVILWYVLQVIAYWRIFTKAGEAGWKSLIPIYNTYVQYRISWDAKFFWILALIAVVTGILSAVELPFVPLLGGLAIWFINVVAFYKLSLAYGHGVGFAIGLFFLSPIFMLILGLGSSQYQGPQ